jgi:hypothetical protein
MQTHNLKARMNRLRKFIVNARDFNFHKRLLLQRKYLFRIVNNEGFKRRGFVAEEGLQNKGVEDGVEFAIKHRQRCDLYVRVLITKDITLGW